MKDFLQNTDYLDMAYLYATKTSGCCKVAVGCVIEKQGHMISFGSNKAILSNCKSLGCYRARKYGNDSKIHRNPDDCSSIHSEVDALSNLRESAVDAIAYVTRYPCEGCAKALISAGISMVVYGGTTEISDLTRRMFDNYNIRVLWIPDWKEDNSDR